MRIADTELTHFKTDRSGQCSVTTPEDLLRSMTVRPAGWLGVTYACIPIGTRTVDWGKFIPPQELDRGLAMKSGDRCRAFLATRAALRALLADTLNTAPRAIEIRTAATGKPYIPDHAIHFNVSHTKDWAAIAISSTCEVGIDIEAPRRFRFPDKLSAKLPCIEGMRLLDRWTLAESVLKALSLGVHALEGLAIAGENGHAFLFSHGKQRAWARRVDCHACPAYGAAISVRTESD